MEAVATCVAFAWRLPIGQGLEEQHQRGAPGVRWTLTGRATTQARNTVAPYKESANPKASCLRVHAPCVAWVYTIRVEIDGLEVAVVLPLLLRVWAAGSIGLCARLLHALTLKTYCFRHVVVPPFS